MVIKQIGWERWVDFDPEEGSSNPEELGFDLVPLAVRTPIGQYSPYESMAPTKMFDCWMCYTNFDISDYEEILDDIEGIEVLKVMTKYRIFIGIGKMFSLTEVRPRVEVALGVTNPSIIDKFIKEISGKEQWAIYVYSDGSHKIITSKLADDPDFTAEKAVLDDTEAVNIITSSDFERI